MRGLGTMQAVLCSLAFMVGVAAKEDPDYNPSLNFRPNNVTLSILDYWVGSYYNGTTDVEFSFYTGLASNWSFHCPNLVNTTVTKQYNSTVLALTEPSTYNVGYDPVNAFFTMWSNNFNFSTLPGPSWDGLQEDASLKFAMFSSDPTYQVDGKAVNNFNWTLNPTQGPPYSLSSTLTEYDPQGGWGSNLASCNGSDPMEWNLFPAPWTVNGNGLYLPDPVLDLQFDGKTANLSLNGYFIGYDTVKEGTMTSTDGMLVVGGMKVSFLGVLDAYHSDVLANNTATPTWLRTVGFQNDSLNVGYTSTASNVSRGKLVLATTVALTVIIGFV
ncbi:hypothetical protein BO79DRAFT_263126 [Aspergillus costaricaensis CBS 115574]|uniref:Uncharacterized protein n=1 Tax=Aspergillus costaricaensis CBS 115574 TaxID=1448317 RepID=A0ACD1IJE9_9EURO|nr:hypothetical protein BO79DRAFT_263126 [Aspergillus costaricaensis CBS 115574]RAK90359.1 hypothetical protein BO79DRAFT_263126 [Aspergillus costaricaensis CBS 115574]